jgi:hypothetical protein
MGLRYVILVVLWLLLAFQEAQAKRGASGKMPLGKFRVSGVAKSKMAKPLAGPGSLDKLELMEERKLKIEKKLQDADEKIASVKAKREARHKRKIMTTFINAKQDMREAAHLSEEDGEDQLESPARAERRGPSGLRRLLAARKKKQ